MKAKIRNWVRSFGYDVRRIQGPSVFAFEDTSSLSIPFSSVRLNGFTYYVPEYARHRPAAETLLSGSLYEPRTHELVSRSLARFPGSLVHAGAFFGDMIPTFSRVTDGVVYVFEPVFENYALCRLSTNKNELRNVVLFNAALDRTVGTGRISSQDSDTGLHLGGASHLSESGVLVTTMTIDSVGAENISLIHLDVEGHELEALIGAQQTIETSEPLLAIEDMHDRCSNHLTSIGYEMMATVPGLNIWSPQKKREGLHQILQGLA